MTYFTSNTYILKRKILTFTNKISKHLSKPERKFTADITYGILASGSCLLTDVADQLHEDSKKINIVDRLSRHLDKGTPAEAAASYLQQIKKWVPAEPVIYIDEKYTLQLKKITSLPIPLLLRPWNKARLSLKKQLFVWIVVMMITRCS